MSQGVATTNLDNDVAAVLTRPQPGLYAHPIFLIYVLTFSKCFFPFHSFASLLLLLFIAVALRPSRYFF